MLIDRIYEYKSFNATGVRLNTSKKVPLSSHAFKKGQLVVFKNITWESENHSGFYSDYLHEIVKVHRASNYLEIRETKCQHVNRKSWGSDGTDIRLANDDEIRARHRLPKTISYTKENPDGEVVFLAGRNDVLKIVHYVVDNTLLLIDKQGNTVETEIFEIREADPDERISGVRKDVSL